MKDQAVRQGLRRHRVINWIVGARYIGEVQPCPKVHWVVYGL